MKKTGFTHDDKDNISVDWYTPPWIFESLGLHFDLDPSSPVGGVPWIPVSNIFTEKDNGLEQDWFGNVWLNPPYGRLTYSWLEKMHSYRNGIALVFARTDCAWFHDFCAKADAILYLKGRVKFVDGLGKTGNSGAGSGSMLIAWGADNVRALEGMSDKGLLVKLK